jgi:hypothetical protein
MVGELLSEIMNATGVQAFNFDLDETTARFKDFLNREKYFVYVARDDSASAVGFVALYESYALYAEGSFGTIPELYVRRTAPSMSGTVSVKAKSSVPRVAGSGWRSNATLPRFDKALAFYEREGFAIAGGRKLKWRYELPVFHCGHFCGFTDIYRLRGQGVKMPRRKDPSLTVCTKTHCNAE